MNREQTKLLKTRLSRLNDSKCQVFWRDAPMPKHVMAAVQIAKRWKDQQEKSKQQRRERLAKAYSKAMNAVMFEDDPKVVLRALETFEAFKP